MVEEDALVSALAQALKRNNVKNGPTWASLLSLLFGVVSILALLIAGLNLSIQTTRQSLEDDVTALSNELTALKLEYHDWKEAHDHRVIAMNTEQSDGIISNCNDIRMAHPDMNFQECVYPARPGAQFH